MGFRSTGIEELQALDSLTACDPASVAARIDTYRESGYTRARTAIRSSKSFREYQQNSAPGNAHSPTPRRQISGPRLCAALTNGCGQTPIRNSSSGSMPTRSRRAFWLRARAQPLLRLSTASSILLSKAFSIASFRSMTIWTLTPKIAVQFQVGRRQLNAAASTFSLPTWSTTTGRLPRARKQGRRCAANWT